MYTYYPDRAPTYYGYGAHNDDHFVVYGLDPYREPVPDCDNCGHPGTHYTRMLSRPDSAEFTYCTRCWTPVRDELVLYPVGEPWFA